ncbi:lysis system i-spanin subunit Rz [Pseudomonas citronellolis]|uniref:lysis system i-spanin subunit Rz n=1 Tax=Pseudomonas citronellolis TaxID=53408 RepID=UPI000E2EF820|nr:lysis system i-spanin subunit Rz [Pseudomonas citronellolis]
MSRAQLLGCVLALLLAFGSGFWLAWSWRGSSAAADLAALQLQHETERGQISQAVAGEVAARAKQRQELQLQLDGIDQQRYGELRHAQEINDGLAAQLAAAQQRMHAPIVSGSCPAGGVSAGPSAAGMDDGAQYAELQPAAAADLARLAADADACAVKLTALQGRERTLRVRGN